MAAVSRHIYTSSGPEHSSSTRASGLVLELRGVNAFEAESIRRRTGFAVLSCVEKEDQSLRGWKEQKWSIYAVYIEGTPALISFNNSSVVEEGRKKLFASMPSSGLATLGAAETLRPILSPM